MFLYKSEILSGKERMKLFIQTNDLKMYHEKEEIYEVYYISP